MGAWTGKGAWGCVCVCVWGFQRGVFQLGRGIGSEFGVRTLSLIWEAIEKMLKEGVRY